MQTTRNWGGVGKSTEAKSDQTSISKGQVLRVARQEDIVRLEIADTARRNALSDRFWTEFSSALEKISRWKPAVVTITGKGGFFSAGGDLHRMWRTAPERSSQSLVSEWLKVEHQRLAAINETIVAWVSLEAKRLAVIGGPAVGAGLSLALSCDYRLMNANAWLDSGFARLNLPGDCGISYFLPKLAGEDVAAELIAQPRRVTAAEAASIGLVDKVTHSGRIDQATANAVQELRASKLRDGAATWSLTELRACLRRELRLTLKQKNTAEHIAALEGLVGGGR